MIEDTVDTVSGFVDFLLYFGLGLLLLGVFWKVYTWLTPHDEMALVRENNVAASVALSGALLGFAVPMASAITHSQSLPDCAVWGGVAFVVQVLTFIVLRFTLPHLPARIAKGELAAAILTAALSISVGLINASAMTYW
jgi:putative membrane protein